MPAHYGATSRGRSERNDGLVDLAAAIGRRLNYVGIADIDAKYDTRDGQYKYFELNPRLGVCHYFGTRCGTNLTLDAYRLACGEDLPEAAPQVEGRRFLAVLEEIGGRLQDGDSWLAVLRGILVALLHRPVGAYFAPDDVWRALCGCSHLLSASRPDVARAAGHRVHQAVQPERLSICRRPPLLVTQRPHRINERGPSGGNVHRAERHQREE